MPIDYPYYLKNVFSNKIIQIIRKDDITFCCRVNPDKIDFDYLMSLPKVKQDMENVTLELVLAADEKPFSDIKIKIGDILKIQPVGV